MLGAFQFSILDWNIEAVNWLIRLFIAGACGFAIGWERKSRSKEAGIRTHTIVCLAAALMMIVSKYGFSDQILAGERGSDVGRIAAQVVSGIGFLGAGIIFYKRDFLHGLTTAAGIWATSGIGLAIGGGMIIMGVVCTIFIVVLQVVLHKPLKIMKSKVLSVIKVSIKLEADNVYDEITKIFGAKKFLKVRTVNHSDGTLTADIEVATDNTFSPQELYDIAKNYPFINSIEKVDEL